MTFDSLKTLLAKATPLRSGDVLAGVAAESERERVAAQIGAGRCAAQGASSPSRSFPTNRTRSRG